MSLPTTTVRDGGGVGGWVWAARDCGPTPEPYYTTTKLPGMHYRYAFHTESFSRK